MSKKPVVARLRKKSIKLRNSQKVWQKKQRFSFLEPNFLVAFQVEIRKDLFASIRVTYSLWAEKDVKVKIQNFQNPSRKRKKPKEVILLASQSKFMVSLKERIPENFGETTKTFVCL